VNELHGDAVLWYKQRSGRRVTMESVGAGPTED
jgi:hypothetical protein